MELLRIKALRGPNRWSRRTAIEATVSCSPLEQNLSGVSRFLENLRALASDEFLYTRTEEEALSLAHMLGSAALYLQRRAGCEVALCKISATPEAGTWLVVVGYDEEEVGRKAMAMAAEPTRFI